MFLIRHNATSTDQVKIIYIYHNVGFPYEILKYRLWILQKLITIRNFGIMHWVTPEVCKLAVLVL